MRCVWTPAYFALYDRTYRVLYTAGLDEKLADEIAKQRTLAAAVKSSEKAFRRSESSDDLLVGNFRERASRRFHIASMKGSHGSTLEVKTENESALRKLLARRLE